MNDKELIDYIEAHARTELGQTHRDHVVRLVALAGHSTDHLTREWYFLSSAEVAPLIAAARAGAHLRVIYCGAGRGSSLAEVFAGHGLNHAAIVSEYGPIFSLAGGREHPAVELWLVPDPSVCHVPEHPKSVAAGGRYVWHWRVAQDHPQAQPFTAFFDGEWPIDQVVA